MTSNLLPASFKGFPFYVDSDGFVFGREKTVHNVPYRSHPLVEDVGLKNKETTLSAYFLGDDCHKKIQDFIRLADTDKASGLLIHPILGESACELTASSIKTIHSDRSYNYALLELTFLEVGKQVYPLVSTNNETTIAKKETSVNLASLAHFSKYFKTIGKPSKVVANAIVSIKAMASGFNSLLISLDKTLEIADDIREGIEGIQNGASILVQKPLDLAQRVQAVFSQFSSVANNPSEKLQVLRSLKNPIAPLILPIGIDLTNQDQLFILHETTKAVSIGTVLVKAVFASYEDAINALSQWTQETKELHVKISDYGGFELATTLADFVATVGKQVREASLPLPRLKTITLPVAEPSLVLAYNLYEDLSQETDLLKRNKVQHPLVVRAGEIEVLV